jgi:PAS domain S-box-containing protein
VLTVDTGGVITSWNKAAESLFGHSAAEAVGQTLALVIPAAFRPRHMAAFHAALDSGSLVHGGKPARIQAMTPEGDSTPLAMTLGLIEDDSGKVSGAVVVLRRPTELEIFA